MILLQCGAAAALASVVLVTTTPARADVAPDLEAMPEPRAGHHFVGTTWTFERAFDRPDLRWLTVTEVGEHRLEVTDVAPGRPFALSQNLQRCTWLCATAEPLPAEYARTREWFSSHAACFADEFDKRRHRFSGCLPACDDVLADASDENPVTTCRGVFRATAVEGPRLVGDTTAFEMVDHSGRVQCKNDRDDESLYEPCRRFTFIERVARWRTRTKMAVAAVIAVLAASFAAVVGALRKRRRHA